VSPVALLQNVLPAQQVVIAGHHLKRLQTAAMLDGALDGAERRFIVRVRGTGKIAAFETKALDAWLKAPNNPELALMQRQSPLFSRRLSALTTHVRPGDLVFWNSAIASTEARWLGEWNHVSLALKDGLMLDAMTLEGSSVSRFAAVLAKVERRLKGDRFAIGRITPPLTAEQLSTLQGVARRLEGRDYAYLSRLDDPFAPMSCSRAVFEALQQIGINASPIDGRLAKMAVLPGDLMRAVTVVGAIDAQGRFQAGDAANAWHIAAWRKMVIQGVDASFQRVPGLWPWLEDLQKRLVRSMRDR
jgi:hypothetical protein